MSIYADTARRLDINAKTLLLYMGQEAQHGGPDAEGWWRAHPQSYGFKTLPRELYEIRWEPFAVRLTEDGRAVRKIAVEEENKRGCKWT